MSFLNIFGIKTKPKAPWSKYYKNNEMKLKVPEGSLYDFIKKNLPECNNVIAYKNKKQLSITEFKIILVTQ